MKYESNTFSAIVGAWYDGLVVSDASSRDFCQ